jgi:hypothetical protein
MLRRHAADRAVVEADARHFYFGMLVGHVYDGYAAPPKPAHESHQLRVITDGDNRAVAAPAAYAGKTAPFKEVPARFAGETPDAFSSPRRIGHHGEKYVAPFDQTHAYDYTTTDVRIMHVFEFNLQYDFRWQYATIKSLEEMK